MNRQQPAPDSIWLHHSGNKYKVLSVASGKSSRSPQDIEGVDFVHYIALMGENKGSFYVRPLVEFMDGRFLKEENASGIEYY